MSCSLDHLDLPLPSRPAVSDGGQYLATTVLDVHPAVTYTQLTGYITDCLHLSLGARLNSSGCPQQPNTSLTQITHDLSAAKDPTGSPSSAGRQRIATGVASWKSTTYLCAASPS